MKTQAGKLPLGLSDRMTLLTHTDRKEMADHGHLGPSGRTECVQNVPHAHFEVSNLLE